MRYVLLVWVDEDELASAEEQDRRRAAYVGLQDELEAQGKLVSQEGLRATDVSTTLRRRGGELFLDDGPLAGTKEQLAGFLVLDCEHLDVELAAKIPAVDHGSIEVRPVSDN